MKSKVHKPTQMNLLDLEVEPETESKSPDGNEPDPEAHSRNLRMRKRVSCGLNEVVQPLSVARKKIEGESGNENKRPADGPEPPHGLAAQVGEFGRFGVGKPQLDPSIQRIMAFGAVIREEAIAHDLSPAMCMFSCLELIGEIIRDHTPVNQRAEVLSTCLAQLWTNYDITSDTTIN
jgi:hypothetical protein